MRCEPRSGFVGVRAGAGHRRILLRPLIRSLRRVSRSASRPQAPHAVQDRPVGPPAMAGSVHTQSGYRSARLFPFNTNTARKANRSPNTNEKGSNACRFTPPPPPARRGVRRGAPLGGSRATVASSVVPVYVDVAESDLGVHDERRPVAVPGFEHGRVRYLQTLRLPDPEADRAETHERVDPHVGVVRHHHRHGAGRGAELELAFDVGPVPESSEVHVDAPNALRRVTISSPARSAGRTKESPNVPSNGSRSRS